MAKQKSTRYRNVATVVYPDSAPVDWLERLRDLHSNFLVSPLHDQDMNANGEPKKAHYHILTLYDAPKSVDQIQEIFDIIGGVGFEPVNSLRGYARYLCHLDNPEKYQYSIDEVVSIGTEDYQSLIGLPSDKYKVIGEMLEYIQDNHILYFSDFAQICREFHPDWFRSLCDKSTVFISAYFRSLNAKVNVPINEVK